jgi:sugar-specific transcriptional regulator TrmB
MLKTLTGFGIKPTDAQVYVFLAKKGPHTGKDLSHAMNLHKHQLYTCLKCLRTKGFVTASRERPALFSAVPFENVVDLLVKTRLEEAQQAQLDKDNALSDWQSMMKEPIE